MTEPGLLPTGSRVALDPRCWRTDSGRLLVGGSPLTAIRLGAAAARRIQDDVLVVADQASARVADRLIATNLGHPDPWSMPPVRPEDLTVIVPVRDRPVQLDRCLAALSPLRVLVIDDASVDAAHVARVAANRRAQLVPLAVNGGPAAARNAGLAHVRTPYVAFVDSDVEVSADVLLLLARHLADPEVALVGPRIEGVVRSAQPRWFERYDASVSSLTLGRTPNTVRPGAAVAWLPSACLVGRVERLTGGFTSSMRVGEDVDLVWRLVAAGSRVRYEPRVVAHHDVRGSVREWLGRKFFYGTGGAVLAQRHGSNIAPAVLPPVMAVAAALILQRRWWSVPASICAVAAGSRSVYRSLPLTTNGRPPARLSGLVAARGLGWAVRQESALLVRHWWPATAVLCLVSSRARRAAVTALIVDAGVALSERESSSPNVLTTLIGRRFDDVAYGAGLWWGAVRQRSTQSLRPRRPGRGTGTSSANRG